MIEMDFPSAPPASPQLSTELSTTPISGVYMLFLADELVYIGRSRDCKARVAAHRSNGRPHDRHLIAPCLDADAVWMEQALIRSLEATQNRVLFSRPPAKPAPLKPALTAGDHPLMIVNKTAARARVKLFGLSQQFEDALRTGAITFRPKNPERAGFGAQSVITMGELIKWCETNATPA